MMVQVFRQDGFLDDARVRHGFFGRQGGVSESVYRSLNCALGSEDDLLRVAENRACVASELGVSVLRGVYQVHGDVCVKASDERPEADALVTDEAGIGISVVTADCAPVLFYGLTNGKPVVAAAHAGWRGALSGVLEATVNAMGGYGVAPADIWACVGPCIAQGSYEVDEGFAENFVSVSDGYEVFFRSGAAADKLQFDLAGFCAARLAAAGVRRVSLMDMDTYGREDDFFSYRRGTHRGAVEYGRQISAIAIV